ncbi:MAG: hypothetical protein ABIP39_08940 [Polyangiaceae bacterium]
MMHRLAFAAATVLLNLACGGSNGPPPKAPEESIDKDPPTAASSHALPPVIHDDEDSLGLTTKEPPPPAPTPDEGSTMNGVAGAPKLTPPTTPAKATGKGPLLTKPECEKLFGKLIDITMAEQGIDPKQAADARAMMKSAASADPAMAGFQNSCVTTLKKSNYTCGMSAKTSAAYQNCLK